MTLASKSCSNKFEILFPVPRHTRQSRRGRHAGSKFAVKQSSGRVATALRSRAGVVDCFDLHDRLTAYQVAWKWQQSLVQTLLEGDSCGHRGTLLLLQHEPVLTLGAGSSEKNLRFAKDNPPFPLYRTERGGEVTFHGPGQLVLYPILNLQYFQTDLHWYLRNLEEVAIRALHSCSGLTGDRIENLTGVWVADKKIAAVGIRARRWVTYHGIALNVTVDLEPFSQIVPCGIADKSVTSVKLLMEQDCTQNQQEESLLLREYAVALLSAFEDVFEVSLKQLTHKLPDR